MDANGEEATPPRARRAAGRPGAAGGPIRSPYWRRPTRRSGAGPGAAGRSGSTSSTRGRPTRWPTATSPARWPARPASSRWPGGPGGHLQLRARPRDGSSASGRLVRGTASRTMAVAAEAAFDAFAGASERAAWLPDGPLSERTAIRPRPCGSTGRTAPPASTSSSPPRARPVHGERRARPPGRPRTSGRMKAGCKRHLGALRSPARGGCGRCATSTPSPSWRPRWSPSC